MGVFGLSLYRVRGASMAPTLNSGDVLILRARAAAAGDVVVVTHPRFGTLVKRLGRDGRLHGDGADSTDAERLGPYSETVPIGVAVIAITPSGLRRLSRRSGRRAGA